VLNIYRRHLEDLPGDPPTQRCLGKLKARGLKPAEIRTYRKCPCPLWIIGTDPRGEYHRRSLNTTSWEVAETLKRDMELGIEVKPKVEISAALEKWKSALLAAKRKPRTIAQVHGAMATSLATWCKHVGIVNIDELGLEQLNDWVKTWDYASTTHRGRIDLARQFFRFALAHKWVTENPAAPLIKPAEDMEPTLPFTAEEEERIFEAATRFGDRRHFGGLWSSNPETARALLLVMRWTGLRASDSVQFEPRKIKSVQLDGRTVAIYDTYQMKTSEWVMCPIPPAAADAIAKAPRLSETHAFIPPADSGYNTDIQSVTNGFYTNYLGPLSTLSGVAEVRAHRFRDTFAVRLLEQGKPLEIVQMLLGHRSIKTTEKHYSPWVRSRQEMLIREVMAMWK
jgi:integrase/recombinase XerD